MQNITEEILAMLLWVPYEKHLFFTTRGVFLGSFNVVLQSDMEAESKSLCNTPHYIYKSLLLIYLGMQSTT